MASFASQAVAREAALGNEPARPPAPRVSFRDQVRLSRARDGNVDLSGSRKVDFRTALPNRQSTLKLPNEAPRPGNVEVSGARGSLATRSRVEETPTPASWDPRPTAGSTRAARIGLTGIVATPERVSGPRPSAPAAVRFEILTAEGAGPSSACRGGTVRALRPKREGL